MVALITATLAAAAPADEPARHDHRLPDEAVARAYFTDAALLTQEGKSVRFFSDVLAGRVVIINGFYTSGTGLSPRQSQVLAALQAMLGESLGREVHIVSISVDPENDTVEKIAEYARKTDARPGWVFLTGEPDTVHRTSRKIGLYSERPEDHSGVYLLGNVRTGLWVKVPLHAQSKDLYIQVQRLLRDTGEPAND